MANPVHVKQRGRDQTPSLGLPPDPQANATSERHCPLPSLLTPNGSAVPLGDKYDPDSPPAAPVGTAPGAAAPEVPSPPRTTSRNPQEQLEEAKVAFTCPPQSPRS